MGEFRVVHIGVAAALAAAVVTGVGLVDAAGPGTASSFVPIVPCRLADTRTSDSVGVRVAPLGAQETVTFAVWGTNGNCSIPTSATGIATNVTAVNPTANGYLTVFPAGETRPLSSNLNWTPASPPTPNQVTVGLSATGAASAFNIAGTVDLIIDIVGYYEPATAGGQGPAGPSGPTGANGANGPAGAEGPSGPAGADGPIGDRGLSAWDTIPSGQTVTGAVVFDLATTTDDTVDFQFTVALPAKAPVGLTVATVNFSNSGSPVADGDPSCTGTAQNPTAPPGKACLYLFGAFNALNLAGTEAPVLMDSAFRVIWVATDVGDTYIQFAWAYTAP